MKRNQGLGRLIAKIANGNGNHEANEIMTVQEKLFVRIEFEMKDVVVVGNMSIVLIVITMIVTDEKETESEVVSGIEVIERTEDIAVTEEIAMIG